MNLKLALGKFFLRIGIVSTFSRLQLFLMAIVAVLVANADNRFVRSFIELLDYNPLGLVLVGGGLLGGMFFSLFYGIFTGKVNRAARFLMIFFAVVITVTTGLNASFYILGNSQSGSFFDPWLIFPALNILYSFLLLAIYMVNLVKVDNIVETTVKKDELVFSVIFVIVLFLYLKLQLDLHWSLIYSIILSYIMILVGIVLESWQVLLRIIKISKA